MNNRRYTVQALGNAGAAADASANLHHNAARCLLLTVSAAAMGALR